LVIKPFNFTSQMSADPIKGPLKEQPICVSCGFCCDGTLFLHAHLNPGERGHLPEKLEQSSYTQGDKDYFRLPCNYFSGKCTIYHIKRADVCSSYRCQLLKDFAGDKLDRNEALKIISEAKKIRKELIDQYRILSGKPGRIVFMEVLSDLGKIVSSPMEDEQAREDFEMLQTRCNIFQALLIKHFRPVGDFENIMATK
jgi:hypothetical protein